MDLLIASMILFRQKGGGRLETYDPALRLGERVRKRSTTLIEYEKVAHRSQNQNKKNHLPRAATKKLQIFTEVRLLIMDTLLVIVWQSRLYRIAGCLMLFPREKEPNVTVLTGF